MAITAIDLSGASDKRVFGLIAGSAGIGKTTLITNFPKEESLYVTIEDGELSIQGSGIAAVKAETYEDMLELIGNIPSWPQRYVMFDSMSEIYDMISRDAKLKFTAKQNFAKHEEITDKLMHVIREARKIKSKDVFFTCHTKEDKNGPIIEQELCFDGKKPAEIKKQFDLVIHMDRKKDENGVDQRVFITDPTISKIAKARVSPFMGVKINPIEEANLYNLTMKLKGEI